MVYVVGGCIAATVAYVIGYGSLDQPAHPVCEKTNVLIYSLTVGVEVSSIRNKIRETPGTVSSIIIITWYRCHNESCLLESGD